MLSPILVIVPTYNEAENIGLLIPDILKAADRSDLAVLVVDDNSTDGTNSIVSQIAGLRTDNRVRLLSRPGKQGLGTAYMAGFRYALDQGFALAISMDADFSHPPERLPDLILAAENADIIVGSRYVKGGRISNWPLRRKILSYGANSMAHAILGARSRDCTSGYRAYRREILEKIPFEKIKSDGYSFLIEMLTRCERAGARVAETPIHFVDRRIGRSKISRKEIFKAFATLWRMFWTRWGR